MEAETPRTPTLTNPAAFRRPEDRDEFFRRVMAATPPVQPAWFHRPFFTRQKRSPLAIDALREEGR